MADVTVYETIGNEDLPVQNIVGIKKEQGTIHYLVRWHPSWERQDFLIGCEDLIEIYINNQNHSLLGDVQLPQKSTGQKEGEALLAGKKKKSGSYARKKPKNDLKEADTQSCGAVSHISGMFNGKDNFTYYQVQWCPTWEPENKLINCQDLIARFFIEELSMEVPSSLLKDGQIISGPGCRPFIKEEPMTPPRIEDPHPDVAILEEDLNTLKFQYQELQSRFEEYATEKEELIKDLEEKNKDIETQLKTLKEKENDGLQKKVDTLKTKIISMKKQKEREGKILINKIEEFENFKNNKDVEIEKYLKKIKEGTSAFEKLKVHKEAEIMKNLKIINDLKGKLMLLKEEKENGMTPLNKKISELRYKNEIIKKEKNSEIEQHKKSYETLSEDFENFKKMKSNDSTVMRKKHGDLNSLFERYKKEKELEVGSLSKKHEGLLCKFKEFQVEKKKEMDLLGQKFDAAYQQMLYYRNAMEIEIDGMKTKKEERDTECAALEKQNKALQSMYDDLKAQKDEEHTTLQDKVQDMTKKCMLVEEENQKLIDENGKLALKYDIASKNVEDMAREKDSEIKSILDKHDTLVTRYKKLKNDSLAENKQLTEKITLVKEKYKSRRDEQEKDVDLLLKKIESQKEKIEKLEEKIEGEEDTKNEKNEIHLEQQIELQEQVDNLTKKIEDQKVKHEKYKADKELLVELLLKQKEDLTKERDKFEEEKDLEIEKLEKKNSEFKKENDALTSSHRTEVGKYIKKNEDLIDKVKDLKWEVMSCKKKNDVLGDRLCGRRFNQNEDHKELLKKIESLKVKSEILEKEKYIIIENLSLMVWKSMHDLHQVKKELEIERMKINFILDNANMDRINSVVLYGLKPFETRNDTGDQKRNANVVEVLSEYFQENSLKYALKDKILEIETLKEDIKELTEIIKKKLNNQPSSKETTEELPEKYEGTNQTLGGMYVETLRQLLAAQRLTEYHRTIYVKELEYRSEEIKNKDERIKDLESKLDQWSMCSTVPKFNLLRSKEVGNVKLETPAVSIDSSTVIKKEEESIQLEEEDKSDDDDEEEEEVVEYKVSGVATCYKKQEAKLILKQKKQNKIPLKLRMKIHKTENLCKTCGNNCGSVLQFKGDIYIHLSENPLKDMCKECCKAATKIVDKNISPPQVIDYRYQKAYEDLINEPPLKKVKDELV